MGKTWDVTFDHRVDPSTSPVSTYSPPAQDFMPGWPAAQAALVDVPQYSTIYGVSSWQSRVAAHDLSVMYGKYPFDAEVSQRYDWLTEIYSQSSYHRAFIQARPMRYAKDATFSAPDETQLQRELITATGSGDLRYGLWWREGVQQTLLGYDTGLHGKTYIVNADRAAFTGDQEDINDPVAKNVQILVTDELTTGDSFVKQATQGDAILAESALLGDVQAAIASASPGQTVLLPAGVTVNWSGGVSISGITLDLNGCTIRLNASGETLISVSLHPTQKTRITNGIFADLVGSGTYQGRYVEVDGSDADALVEIDNNTMNATLQAVKWRVSRGVFHNNVVSWSGQGELLHNEGYGFSSTYGWDTYIVTPGGSDMLFVEDNVFNNSGSGGYMLGGSAIQNYYGSRTCFRNNTLYNCQFDNHGTAGMIGGRWWEIYDNDFICNINCDKTLQLRAGSGVVFNNTLSGNGSGSRAALFWEEDSGTYPLDYQVGVGLNMTYDPAYYWSNPTLIGPWTEGPIVIGRDVLQSAKPGYSPYQYPHPERSDQ